MRLDLIYIVRHACGGTKPCWLCELHASAMCNLPLCDHRGLQGAAVSVARSHQRRICNQRRAGRALLWRSQLGNTMQAQQGVRRQRTREGNRQSPQRDKYQALASCLCAANAAQTRAGDEAQQGAPAAQRAAGAAQLAFPRERGRPRACERRNSPQASQACVPALACALWQQCAARPPMAQTRWRRAAAAGATGGERRAGRSGAGGRRAAGGLPRPFRA